MSYILGFGINALMIQQRPRFEECHNGAHGEVPPAGSAVGHHNDQTVWCQLNCLYQISSVILIRTQGESSSMKYLRRQDSSTLPKVVTARLFAADGDIPKSERLLTVSSCWSYGLDICCALLLLLKEECGDGTLAKGEVWVSSSRPRSRKKGVDVAGLVPG